MKYTAAVLTISDKGARGEREDLSGPAVRELLQEAGFEVRHTQIIPDEMDEIRAALIRCCDELGLALVLTTGGTGFSPRDVTPEATLSVIERETPGIPEAMRAESLRITPRGCLSRSRAGIRGRTLIINLPGSPRAAKENISAVLPAVSHGLEMLMSAGSADCAAPDAAQKKASQPPSLDAWLREAKAQAGASQVGMYLCHNGVVRETARARVRQGDQSAKPVTGMRFACDRAKAAEAEAAAREMDGVFCVRCWLNEGRLEVGDSIMQVLIGTDTRPHAIAALEWLVGRIKSECVQEEEVYAED
ncbi:MAG: MogA/MoaB family molybdenum cofactor biosynthesis protein [Clostridia bacterium]|nr:MogA/MoaB family molybdenum cofactor biosynthesis protein [Clostridia bacterium]